MLRKFTFVKPALPIKLCSRDAFTCRQGSVSRHDDGSLQKSFMLDGSNVFGPPRICSAAWIDVARLFNGISQRAHAGRGFDKDARPVQRTLKEKCVRGVHSV